MGEPCMSAVYDGVRERALSNIAEVDMVYACGGLSARSLIACDYSCEQDG